MVKNIYPCIRNLGSIFFFLSIVCILKTKQKRHVSTGIGFSLSHKNLIFWTVQIITKASLVQSEIGDPTPFGVPNFTNGTRSPQTLGGIHPCDNNADFFFRSDNNKEM